MDKNDKLNEEKEILEWIKSIGLAIAIALIIKTFVFSTTYVLGDSMYPTLYEKDRLISNRIPKCVKNVTRGDIVIIKAPDVANKKYIKRVIGIEGDVVEIKDDKVYLNDSILIEPYINDDVFTFEKGRTRWEVPKDMIFVLGDNRCCSKDSRNFGCVHIKDIKGITTFRFFPFNRFGKISK